MQLPYPVIAKNISYRRGFRNIIANISLVLKKSEFAGLIGGSGSGKTTLLTCLNGFRTPTRGKVVLCGLSSGERKRLRSRIGYVPQEDIVHRTLTVERALFYSAMLRRPGMNAAEAGKKVDETLAALDLADRRRHKIGSLSGGQRKRVNIGVELMHSPSLFFLDEPSAGLDPGLERQLMRHLRNMSRQGRTVLVTTHLMQHIDLFDVLGLIHRGRLVYFGPASEIRSFFGVGEMVELFDRIGNADPDRLFSRFAGSALYRRFLMQRLRESRP
jgi:ABC-type multidrug transport system ATPase subunit